VWFERAASHDLLLVLLLSGARPLSRLSAEGFTNWALTVNSGSEPLQKKPRAHAIELSAEQLSMELVPDIDRLTQIFSNAVAPSFFLGAIAAFVSLMMSRLATVNGRIKATRETPIQDSAAVGSGMALGSFARRSRLLNDGIILSLGSGVCATLLLAALFASQFFGLRHVYGAGVLFFAATILLGVALFRFAQEAWLSRSELEE
jgi:hypothetical protein